ncbi:lipase family protein [Mycobacterium haemophilum]|uniref:Triacylglycerol lipase n=1 Tax=Mycobacterium haemophilum TaxID=29311 RepID=A0A0I9TUM8_9MYCO|nr:lipase family protein [Mycobacterium haemophilum]KLO32230.1 triacylglycerol lipase [Mycobacterium haemophilum]KLO36637.1 triacylglycerol lipase [Mycobacterium haemophilum]KLO42565.1 triacylglycerol lipase [Mycobacterium haemophilum]KLO55442.1 triacylglycerol lipase [Mycobacterium haemophilum]
MLRVSSRQIVAVVLSLICATTIFVRYSPPAHAEGNFDSEGDQSQFEEFYTPPDPLPPGQPGDLIRTEPMRLVLEPSGQLGAILATAARIMYRSTDARGRPVAVTGTYLEPDSPWPGKGPRPLLSYGPGTQGQGDQCAPSRMFSQGIHWSSGLDFMVNYEETFVATMVARGFAIVMTDYDGLGTPGVHTYVNRLAEGQAMLDAARAAQRLPGTSLDPHGPVGFWGYSQGGGAAASAAELASAYAPDLNVVGTYSGAPPANLAEMLPYIDGNALVGVTGYLLNGAIYAYPEWADAIHAQLTPRGEDLLAKTRHQCVGETLFKFQFRHLAGYFNGDIDKLIDEEPFKTLFDMQRIGRYKPNAPVFIDSNRYDPLVPWTPANQLGRDWCAQGADVQFWTNEEPPFLNKTSINHVLTAWVDGERAMQWIADRFNGLPTTPNCGEF